MPDDLPWSGPNVDLIGDVLAALDRARHDMSSRSTPGERVYSADTNRTALRSAPEADHGQPCAACGTPVGDSVSDDFCDPVCQRAWTVRECSDGYESPHDDAAPVYVGADSARVAPALPTSTPTSLVGRWTSVACSTAGSSRPEALHGGA